MASLVTGDQSSVTGSSKRGSQMKALECRAEVSETDSVGGKHVMALISRTIKFMLTMLL